MTPTGGSRIQKILCVTYHHYHCVRSSLAAWCAQYTAGMCDTDGALTGALLFLT